ncbi:MAG: bifunctional phosphoribosyl-AMP cyclohydrolase/phosphoribosyl-ATP diphosphatase HisIE [Clostridia bacterium]|nr:bifunctional phosphoribosyl-AMP cyclohydrolase/phosphoribosyl-ATP diphosphatase HisIE [Clostridia bacterium]
MLTINDLKFDDKGLIPAIVTDYETGEVLTLAYMNKESLQISLDEKMTCFWSRSRKELWRKGATSGNRQHITKIVADCDRDALTVYVRKDGPACHLGNESCFVDELFINEEEAEAFRNSEGTESFRLEGLYGLLEGRKAEMPEGSYTTYLFQKGLDKILKKVGEESTEVIIAGKAEDKAETIYEIADLAYHVIVLMVEIVISLDEVRKELASRHFIDHKVKHEKMGVEWK